MCGGTIDVNHFKHPQSKTVRPSPSHKAMSKFIDLYKTECPEEALLQRQTLETEFPKSDQNPGYHPWSPEEYAKLSLAYKTHWAKIRQNPRFTIIDPST